MNKAEVTKLLAVAGAFDRWIRLDEMTVVGWGEILAHVPYALAVEAVKAHYAGPNAHKDLRPADIITAVNVAARLTRGQVEADVRSAKARGLVDKSWPDSRVLTDAVRVRLAEAREADRAELLALGSTVEPVENGETE